MLVAGAGTLVFNGNPLVRFDGYYALSDLLEIPNLWSRSRAAAGHLVRVRLLGMREGVDPAHDGRERAWLIAYALASTLYRVLICGALLLFLGNWGGGGGIAIGMLAVVSWLLWPALRSSASLYRDAADAAPARVAIAAGALTVAIAVAAFVPLPDHERAEGIVEPSQLAYVYIADEGVVESVLPSGSAVSPDGAPIARARNVELEAQRDGLDAELRLVELDRSLAEVEDPGQARALGEKERVVREEIRRVRERIARLELRAPFAGRWLAPDVERMNGAFVRPDPKTPLGVVASDAGIVVRVVTDQTLGPRIAEELGEGAAASVRPRGRPDLGFDGVIERIVSGGQAQLPAASLGTAGGGALATNPRDPQGLRPDERFFEVRVRPRDGAAPALLTGQRAVVRFALAPRPALAQLWTAARQLVQRRLRI
jgi:putative peptide zinc metalloprotease protein